MAKPTKPTNSVAIVKGASPVETISKLETALAKLKRIQETPWKTSGEFGDGFPNIKTTQNVGLGVLIRMSAASATRADLYHRAAARLGKTNYPAFEISGFDDDSWQHDIKLRMDIDEQENVYTTLKGFQEKMSKFLSEADQKEQLENEITQFMANL
jgi:hypothetical protein